MFNRAVPAFFAIIFSFLIIQCREDYCNNRSFSPVIEENRFSKFYNASWLHIDKNNGLSDLKKKGLTENVRYVLEKSYSLYYKDGVYFTAHIFNQRCTRDYFQFSFFDSIGFMYETWKYDHSLRLESHVFYHRKNEDSVRRLFFWDDYPREQIKEICDPIPADYENRIYQYEYDYQGNWIKRTEFHDSIARHVVERTIGYF